VPIEEVLNFKGIEDRRQVNGFELNIGDDSGLDVTNGVWLCCSRMNALCGNHVSERFLGREQKGARCSIQDEKKDIPKIDVANSVGRSSTGRIPESGHKSALREGAYLLS
jgi:hypothetical protein